MPGIIMDLFQITLGSLTSEQLGTLGGTHHVIVTSLSGLSVADAGALGGLGLAGFAILHSSSFSTASTGPTVVVFFHRHGMFRLAALGIVGFAGFASGASSSFTTTASSTSTGPTVHGHGMIGLTALGATDTDLSSLVRRRLTRLSSGASSSSATGARVFFHGHGGLGRFRRILVGLGFVNDIVFVDFAMSFAFLSVSFFPRVAVGFGHLGGLGVHREGMVFGFGRFAFLGCFG
mmetsp:Transcript_31005/g.59487  ORF Transcript_31005/g.59487 Transcript_31005/m.59487 type:complete len:234 (+) Transcript_31005:233-934(+)